MVYNVMNGFQIKTRNTVSKGVNVLSPTEEATPRKRKLRPNAIPKDQRKFPGSGGARAGSGRKKKPISEQTSRDRKEPFILPDIPKTRNTHTMPDFINWYHSLNEEQVNRLTIYVYRGFPVIDNKLVDPSAVTNIDKLTGDCPFDIDNWEHDIMKRWGSGDYSFMVKENATHRWTVFCNGLRDYNNYPPMIDYRTLVLGDPKNKEYVAGLRVRGLLDNLEKPEGDNETDMQIADTINRLVEANQENVERVVEMAGRREEEGSTSMASTIVQVLQRQVERAEDRADRLAEQAAAAPVQTMTVADPIATFERTAQVLKEMATPVASDNSSMRLMETFLAQSREELKEAREETRELRRLIMEQATRPPVTTPAPAPAAGGLFTGLEDAIKLKSQLIELGMVKADSDIEPPTRNKGITDELISMAVRNGPTILQSLGTIVEKGLIFYAMTKGVTVQQPNAQQPVQAPGYPADTQSPQQTQQALPASVVAELSPQQKFIANISETLMYHMDSENLDGHTFAGWLISSSGSGRRNYDMMKEAGAEALIGALQTYEPLWSVISRTPSKLSAFLNEFLEYDAWEAEGETEDDDAPEVPAKV